jgi:NAD(P)-dependent dehydrogenase (short-subunit alcohol dehydrogenase family)
MKRVAVVTGASRGIGLALAQGLASDHDLVIAASRALEASEELERAMRQSDGRIRSVTVDLADEPSIAAMVATRLSEPFRKGAPRVLSPTESAAHLLELVRTATPEQSGRFFAWDGAELPW